MQLIRLLFLVTLAVHVSSSGTVPTGGQNDPIPLVDLPAPPARLSNSDLDASDNGSLPPYVPGGSPPSFRSNGGPPSLHSTSSPPSLHSTSGPPAEHSTSGPPSFHSTNPHPGADQLQRPASALAPPERADAVTAPVPARNGSPSALEAQVPPGRKHEPVSCVVVTVAICVAVAVAVSPVLVPLVLEAHGVKKRGFQSRGPPEAFDWRQHQRCDCKDATMRLPDAYVKHIPNTKHTQRDVLKRAYRPRITTWSNQATDLPAEA
ncbi:hypothetical protein DFH05DRAFT_1106908 [Lentinula detonsa]|uniref:Uncharacterized protein n=1 Tax=Lentinula detonsa TaxID=2804962 RepID=A0A9W8P1B1_9AGAR|nr:hypothetical protein DFH05DRAFT_1106908 [Lentinula detonsa]KAJ3982536.1 hypothetical protein F5890DRAFT_1555806 [Lentinula detonsa]